MHTSQLRFLLAIVLASCLSSCLASFVAQSGIQHPTYSSLTSQEVENAIGEAVWSQSFAPARPIHHTPQLASAALLDPDLLLGCDSRGFPKDETLHRLAATCAIYHRRGTLASRDPALFNLCTYGFGTGLIWELFGGNGIHAAVVVEQIIDPPLTLWLLFDKWRRRKDDIWLTYWFDTEGKIITHIQYKERPADAPQVLPEDPPPAPPTRIGPPKPHPVPIHTVEQAG